MGSELVKCHKAHFSQSDFSLVNASWSFANHESVFRVLEKLVLAIFVIVLIASMEAIIFGVHTLLSHI